MKAGKQCPSPFSSLCDCGIGKLFLQVVDNLSVLVDQVVYKMLEGLVGRNVVVEAKEGLPCCHVGFYVGDKLDALLCSGVVVFDPAQLMNEPHCIVREVHRITGQLRCRPAKLVSAEPVEKPCTQARIRA